MKSAQQKSEYKRIFTFMNQIMPKTDHFREQIQTALSDIWGYHHTIFWISDEDGSISNPELHGIKPHTLDEYKEHFEDLDLLHPKKLLSHIPKQRIFNFYNTHSHTHFYNSHYYTEFLKKYHFKDEMAVNFIHNHKLIATLGILRTEGEQKLSLSDIKRFEMIYNIIFQKLADFMFTEKQSIENRLYRQVMDHSADAYMLVNQTGKITYRNESAYKLMEHFNSTTNKQLVPKQLVTHFHKHTHAQLVVTPSGEYYRVHIVKQPEYHSYVKEEPTYLIHLQKETNHHSLHSQLTNGVLTPREKEVCHLLLKGLTNNHVAAELFISINTVKKHIQNIYDKLSVRNRSQLFNKLFNE